jgi:hypothetical protein
MPAETSDLRARPVAALQSIVDLPELAWHRDEHDDRKHRENGHYDFKKRWAKYFQKICIHFFSNQLEG